MWRYLKLVSLAGVWFAVVGDSNVMAGWFSDSTSITIEKAAQNVGKSIEKIQTDRQAVRPTLPEQSPSNPCRNNPALPQCKDLGTVK